MQGMGKQLSGNNGRTGRRVREGSLVEVGRGKEE